MFSSPVKNVQNQQLDHTINVTQVIQECVSDE